MHPSCDQFDRFLNRLHRRLWICRFIESAGIGALVGSIAAMPIACVLLWRGDVAFAPPLILLALGAGGGILWQVRRRPTRMHAARCADSQLGLHDLLSSALCVRHDKDPWAHSLLAMAEDRCMRIAPSSVVLHRFGLRAWSGIGVSVALAISAAMLNSVPQTSDAHSTDLRTSNRPKPAISTQTALQEAHSTFSNISEPRVFPRAASQRLVESGSIDGGPGEQGRSAGRDASSSASSDAGTLPPVIGQTDPRTGGEVASGGLATENLAGEVWAGGSYSARVQERSDRPLWERSTWPDDRRQALHRLETGQVPDAYRELVREFFQR